MKSRRGFTLVELLVVIGIIVVLIAILLPAVNKARASAYAVACQSNLRQVGMSILMYCSDNSGTLPRACRASTDGSNPNSWSQAWGAMIADGVMKVAGTVPMVPDLDTAQSPAVNVFNVPGLLCPAESQMGMMPNNANISVYSPTVQAKYLNSGAPGPVFTSAGTDFYAAFCSFPVANSNAQAAVLTHYALNTCDPLWYQYIAAGWGNLQGFMPFAALYDPPYSFMHVPACPPVRLASIKNNPWLACDGVAGWYGCLVPAYRHPNLTGNFLYDDGHVEALSPGQITGGYFNGTGLYQVEDSRLFAHN